MTPPSENMELEQSVIVSPWMSSFTIVGPHRPNSEVIESMDPEQSVIASPLPSSFTVAGPRRPYPDVITTPLQAHHDHVGPSALEHLAFKDYTISGGPSTVTMGDSIQLWYQLQLSDGVVVDSCMQGTSFKLVLDDDRLLPAIDQGIVGMKVNGECLVKIPPALGYGN
ncbi:uncharacterized protein LAESUDRAFT_765549 [Laetiporus sulphureus 93-53]|uniref:peptidylprolyl isomerase n=1 Tax=Laetiporus sulphureus 93-53 TaxID=1314785 RepID=A0A165APS1_9APHY|nr:uncharacterized protein LAESUDRAFT_765549 [Laetiporus sulphureus 93-53]KZS99420.1 hypothetical protein LAESUDRAFT_765549 [Laetiporus sulphureus 93-53]